MSEFKFACSVCGQHITADSSTSGGQIECPTCFQKIVVPQAPATEDTKFILSASQVSKPRPSSLAAAAAAASLPTPAPRSSLPATILLLFLLAAAGAALYVFRDRVFKSVRAPVPVATNTLASAAAPVALNTNYPTPTNIAWTLDLTNIVFPATPAAGSIHGSGFVCEKAVLRGGLLSLSQGKAWPWDLALALNLFARQGEELSGKTVQIEPERPRAPRVVLRWKDAQQQSATETIGSGYALKVVFGVAANGRMPGQIYICLPDAAKSFVAGTFDAEIRKAPPPKNAPRSPPRPKG